MFIGPSFTQILQLNSLPKMSNIFVHFIHIKKIQIMKEQNSNFIKLTLSRSIGVFTLILNTK